MIASALDQVLSVGQAAQVAVMVTDDNTVQGLNHEYRGIDEVTDVLSFSADHPGHWEGSDEVPEDRLTASNATDEALPFTLPPDELPTLGEVIISYPQTQRQSRAQAQSLGFTEEEALKRELALLLVHGVLHLVGHDHVEYGQTADMQAKEQAALAPIFE